MNYNLLTKLMIISLFLVACVTVKPVVSGGDKSAGTITVQWEGNGYTQVDSSTTRQDARVACQAWNYKDAKPFGFNEATGNLPVFSTCVWRSGFGCSRYRYTVTYQCID